MMDRPPPCLPAAALHTPPMDEAAALRAHRQCVEALVNALRTGRGAAVGWPQALPAGCEVEQVQTHISTVLLAGDHALKLKKPLRLPFLDFSTLARRAHCCEEELRVNRRTAPQLYLAVLPLTGGLEAPQLGGPGPVFDVGVWMRRFDGRRLYACLAREGRLTAAHVDALAQAVAAFQAAQAPSPASWGDPAEALRWALDTLAELHTLAASADLAPPAGASSAAPDAPDGPQIRQALQALERWTRERHAQIALLMQHRREAGAVIEGHGDLHLGNIVEHEDRALLFDAIEFDPALRHADRMADLAFPFMDLLDHAQPRLAWRWLSQVLEAGGDHDGLPLLRWHAVYRALVRAKVDLLSARQQPAGAARDAACARAWERVALAQALAWPPAPPALVLSTGLSGSGKSTVALELVQSLGAVRVRSDVERKRLYGLAATDRPADPAQLYHPQATVRTYERLAQIARVALEGGVSVVVDAVFNRRSEREALREVARACGATFAVLECRAPDRVLAQRVTSRRAAGRDASDADAAVVELQRRSREPLDAREGLHQDPRVATVDTDCAPEVLRGRLEGWLRGWGVSVLEDAGPSGVDIDRDRKRTV
jgi:aminoglycoside phosphotransferase family enzyme/predicted kinase